MIFGFVTNNLGAGGAQKMMAFVISSIAPYAEKVYVIMSEKINNYNFQENVEIRYISEYIKTNKNAIQRIREFESLANDTKNIIISEKIDCICAFGYYYTTIGVRAVKGTNCKLIGSERRSPQMLAKVYQLISSYAYTHCDKVVFQLEGARNYFPRIDDNKVAIIPNPFIRKQIDISNVYDRRKVITMAAARLEVEKGFDIGIKAMSEVVKSHPDYVMEIFGDGDFEQLYGTLLDKLSIRQYVKYMGFSRNIISEIYDSMIFLLPSRSEGIPNMLMEALAAGIPCVASDCPPGGPKMLLDNNKNGLLVPLNDSLAMAKAICELIENSKLRESISDNARSVVDRFSPEKIALMWVDCFLSLI